MDLSALTKEHLALLIAVLVGVDWVLKRLRIAWQAAKDFVTSVLDERFPNAIKATLSNGGGEIIRKIVREENDVQSRANQVETIRIVNEAIKAHEHIEAEREQKAHDELIAEITDRFNLRPARKVAR